MKVELTANCSDLEEMIKEKYGLVGDPHLTDVEFDELGDLVAIGVEVEASDSKLICRQWDARGFVEGLIEEAI